ncbi:MAG TPA: PhzF family phenazine biosynthesis protein [Woeseiaceae bacterium]|jgi:PhzF family phenazine biosynthesis protein|nr:PhzF family phenazine biosynthesis protein [Woeseiaceae bacterium]
MKIPLYQVDAFASRAFEGNPAAVCPLQAWLPDGLMQAIAAENNLSETAFFVAEGGGYAIRWFTPEAEVELCGHATLASAFVVFNELGFDGDTVVFDSRSGPLPVTRDADRLTLDFPAQPPEACATPPEVEAAFGGIRPVECLRSADLLVVLGSAGEVRSASPDIGQLARVPARGIIITAADTEYDFVARFFAPAVGIPEDPVTGSAYTQLAPYWAARTGKTRFHARQVSRRGGDVTCELAGDRVLITGRAVKILAGAFELGKVVLP